MPLANLGTEIDLWLAVAGVLLLVLGLTSGLISNRWYLSEPLVALLVGVLAGPMVLGWLRLEGDESTILLLHHVSRLTLTIALVDVALSLPTGYVRGNWKQLAVMLAVVMPAMWLVTSLSAFLVLGISFVASLLVGAVLTPTDPVLASAVVQSKVARDHVRPEIRHLLSAESGANDALALPLVLLPLYIVDLGAVNFIGPWLAKGVLWEIALSCTIGFAAGWASAKLLMWSAARPDADHTSLLTVVLSLAIALLGIVHSFDSDGLLAAFVSGLVFNRFVQDKREARHERLHEVMRRFFEIPVFLCLGACLPWSAWWELGWMAIVFAGITLLVRRLPALVMIRPLIPSLRSTTEACYVGWFGPIGIAALYYATKAHREFHDYDVWPIASLLITSSIVAHGVTATVFTKWLAASNMNQGTE